ncbi:MAG TPA: hypothetical protein VL201_01010 [Patescibacteria group bacterium]|jgi:hypothetical protein|nr:hypothetical protein [Patescibacteria group bacterium]
MKQKIIFVILSIVYSSTQVMMMYDNQNNTSKDYFKYQIPYSKWTYLIPKKYENDVKFLHNIKFDKQTGQVYVNPDTITEFYNCRSGLTIFTDKQSTEKFIILEYSSKQITEKPISLKYSIIKNTVDTTNSKQVDIHKINEELKKVIFVSKNSSL